MDKNRRMIKPDSKVKDIAEALSVKQNMKKRQAADPFPAYRRFHIFKRYKRRG